MATRLIDQLRQVLLPESGDGELLGSFIERRDEASLAALVKRHGPMVWGVCRRLLSHHDAEDAFQATFLVLARKAASIASREMVGNWLYGVAHQTALQARRAAMRRRAREVQVTDMPETETVQQDPWPLLDQELSRLPDNYRTVLVLCDLEERTRKEVARQLGVPEGTVAGRLARARAMLAKRLARKGIALSSGALAAIHSQNVASASMLNSTITAAAGRAAISSEIAALAEGVMKAMLMSKLKSILAVVLMLGVMATGATFLAACMAAGQPAAQKPVSEKPVEPAAKQEKAKETFTAWGKEVGGLQAGLGFRPGAKRVYRNGEAVALVLRVRNVGKEAVEFKLNHAFFLEHPPTIRDADGKTVELSRFFAEGLQGLSSTNVAPGKEVELYQWSFDLQPKAVVNRGLLQIHGTGKFSLQCERVVGPTSGNPNHPDPAFDKLATGTLELEVKEAEKKEKEAFTAWGTEVDGVQAGLGFRPGEHRAYRHGETVTLVVRVRNADKNPEAARQTDRTVNYISGYFFDWPPSVTDADGKAAPPIRLPTEGHEGQHGQKKLTLGFGKEAELAEVRIELRPESERGDKKVNTLYGTGKFLIQYQRLMYESGALRIASILNRLSTGKLELEVKTGPAAATEKK